MSVGSLVFPRNLQGLVILLAVMAVAVADVLIKKAATQGSLGTALRSPWLLGAVGLYLFQIVIFLIAFHTGWKLSIIGVLQTALYALIVLTAGVLLYHETLGRMQLAGILLALIGVVLINWS